MDILVPFIQPTRSPFLVASVCVRVASLPQMPCSEVKTSGRGGEFTHLPVHLAPVFRCPPQAAVRRFSSQTMHSMTCCSFQAPMFQVSVGRDFSSGKQIPHTREELANILWRPCSRCPCIFCLVPKAQSDANSSLVPPALLETPLAFSGRAVVPIPSTCIHSQESRF